MPGEKAEKTSGNGSARRRGGQTTGLGGVRLIIGLGNPGGEYRNTRHNAGLLFMDYLAENRPSNFRFPVARILKSPVYMNESGKYVKKIAKKYGASPEEILIAHDDSDIALGEYKLSFGRGAAGHKGVQSVIDGIGTKNFWRLRLGIRPKSEKRGASFFVLLKFKPSELEKIASVFLKAGKFIGNRAAGTDSSAF